MKGKNSTSMGMALALAATVALWVMAGCTKSTPSGPQGDSQTFTSTISSGHSHTVTINKSDVETPPSAGISPTTSSSAGHTHTLTMSQVQLQAVKDGTTQTVTSSSSSGHTHDFSISKWY